MQQHNTKKNTENKAPPTNTNNTPSRSPEENRAFLEEEGCGWLFKVGDVLSYIICCCGCCSSYNDFINNDYD